MENNVYTIYLLNHDLMREYRDENFKLFWYSMYDITKHNISKHLLQKAEGFIKKMDEGSIPIDYSFILGYIMVLVGGDKRYPNILKTKSNVLRLIDPSYSYYRKTIECIFEPSNFDKGIKKCIRAANAYERFIMFGKQYYKELLLIKNNILSEYEYALQAINSKSYHVAINTPDCIRKNKINSILIFFKNTKTIFDNFHRLCDNSLRCKVTVKSNRRSHSMVPVDIDIYNDIKNEYSEIINLLAKSSIWYSCDIIQTIANQISKNACEYDNNGFAERTIENILYLSILNF